uniref:Gametocyte specific factor 1 n=1 Tax=Strix occidentalis caurina TaxID=311401 RepID=A0A8D0FJC2_STROC
MLDLVFLISFFPLCFSVLLDVLDPERLIPCPYNKHHRIRACRFPYHLVKCKKSYPEVAKKLATCPFNARHLVPQADLSDHVLNTSSRNPSFCKAGLPLFRLDHCCHVKSSFHQTDV